MMADSLELPLAGSEPTRAANLPALGEPSRAATVLAPKPPTNCEFGLTKEEFNEMKQELEGEYLATFAQHNVFQQWLASRPTLKTHRNFHLFLTSKKILDVPR